MVKILGAQLGGPRLEIIKVKVLRERAFMAYEIIQVDKKSKNSGMTGSGRHPSFALVVENTLEEVSRRMEPLRRDSIIISKYCTVVFVK